MRTYLGLLTNAVRSALRSKHDLMLENLAVGRQNLMRPTDTHDANLLAPACCGSVKSQGALGVASSERGRGAARDLSALSI